MGKNFFCLAQQYLESGVRGIVGDGNHVSNPALHFSGFHPQAGKLTLELACRYQKHILILEAFQVFSSYQK